MNIAWTALMVTQSIIHLFMFSFIRSHRCINELDTWLICELCVSFHVNRHPGELRSAFVDVQRLHCRRRVCVYGARAVHLSSHSQTGSGKLWLCRKSYVEGMCVRV